MSRALVFIFAFALAASCSRSGSAEFIPSAVAVPVGFKPAVLAAVPTLKVTEYDYGSPPTDSFADVIAYGAALPTEYEEKDPWLADDLIFLYRNNLGDDGETVPAETTFATALEMIAAAPLPDSPPAIAVSRSAYARLSSDSAACALIAGRFTVADTALPFEELARERVPAIIVTSGEYLLIMLSGREMLDGVSTARIESSTRMLRIAARRGSENANVTARMILDRVSHSVNVGYRR